MERISTDLLIIGAGPGGYVSAIYAAKKGLNVCLVDAKRVGGTCLNDGCIPTKALVKSAELYQDI
ncbi:MAG: FAD-dependent oxidoreductase [Tenericutes bacterium]|nr:FAD-dependent oxidoreductase [Mycoplasmatota bacterium]